MVIRYYLICVLINPATSEYLKDPYGNFKHDPRCDCDTLRSTNKCDPNGQCECLSGFYGHNCTHDCACLNPNTKICDPYDGNCYCTYLFTNPLCAHRCDCVAENTESCFMKKCNCKAAHFGPRCENKCDCNATNSRSILCSEIGLCDCRLGYYGRKCNLECECGETAISPLCDASGDCHCKDMLYGKTCDKVCLCNETGTQHNTCAQNDGFCFCRDGFTGVHCEKTCNCSQTGSLHSSCDQYGFCSCLPNYYGQFCHKKCQCQHSINDDIYCNNEGQCKCKKTHWGRDCEKRCRCNVTQSLTEFCDYRGHCQCIAGYHGNKCQRRCKYCESKLSECDNNGYCKCPKGFYGRKCKQDRYVCGKIYTNEWYSHKSARIVNGITPNNPIPWLVRIFINSTWVCNGVIVHDFYVLTLGDCFEKTEIDSAITLILGDYSHDLLDSSERTYTVKHIRFSPKINDNIMRLAILKLRKTILFNSFLQPVCLGTPETSAFSSNRFFADWGYRNMYAQSSTVKTGIFQSIDTVECQKYLEFGMELPPFWMCAIPHTNEFSCLGKLGSPLTYVEENTHYLMGLFVEGTQDCLRPKPSFFLNVSNFNNWIHLEIRSYDTEEETYNYTGMHGPIIEPQGDLIFN